MRKFFVFGSQCQEYCLRCAAPGLNLLPWPRRAGLSIVRDARQRWTPVCLAGQNDRGITRSAKLLPLEIQHGKRHWRAPAHLRSAGPVKLFLKVYRRGICERPTARQGLVSANPCSCLATLPFIDDRAPRYLWVTDKGKKHFRLPQSRLFCRNPTMPSTASMEAQLVLPALLRAPVGLKILSRRDSRRACSLVQLRGLRLPTGRPAQHDWRISPAVPVAGGCSKTPTSWRKQPCGPGAGCSQGERRKN